MIIAVDGPTASGKGTIATALAEHFGLPHLDTGLLYRAVGWQIAQGGDDPDDAQAALSACDFDDCLLSEPLLRREAIGALASRVSVHPEVRAALLQRQRDFAAQPGGAVLDGRDIGTVIAPHADAKLFVSADAEVRAKRRFAEMERRGDPRSYEVILADIKARDARDTGRDIAPLRASPDALLLDTSNLTISTAVQAAIAMVETRLRQL
ncbi:MAG: (d)CMP kinase [Parasphingorhabdus sp.]|nr:(d)CMP kinase [Parasphingorhabdus sp.]